MEMEMIRNLFRRKLRSILTISGIFMGIVALTTMGAMAEHFNSLIGGGAAYYGDHVQVGSSFSGTLGGVIPLAKADAVRQVAGVVAVTPTIFLLAKPGDGGITFGPPASISNSDAAYARYGTLKTTFAHGQDVSETTNGGVVLGSTLATELKKAVGSSIDLPIRPADATADFTNHSFKVVGVLNPTLTAPDTGAYVNLHDAQMLMGEGLPPTLRGNIDPYQLATGLVVYGQPGTNLDTLATRINAEVPGVKALKPSVTVASFKAGGAIFTLITTAAALLALVIGGLSVINTMLMAVTERVREIGLKKALGARTGAILRDFVSESTLIGAIGGVLGLAAGAAVVVMANAGAGASPLFQLTPRLALLSLGFAVLLGAVAGLLPAWRAARLDPVIALHAGG
jgi:putative ABC transport system permease protein